MLPGEPHIARAYKRRYFTLQRLPKDGRGNCCTSHTRQVHPLSVALMQISSHRRRLSRPRHHHFGSRNMPSTARSAAHRLHACLNLLNAHRSRRASTAAEGTSATGNRLRRQVSAVARLPLHSLFNIDPQIGPQTLPAGSPWFGWSLSVPNAGVRHLFAAFNAV